MAAANEAVNEKFRVRSLRKLPGTPLAVEQLRERIIQAHGSLGLASLRSILASIDTSGDGVLDKAELQSGLAKDFGITLSKANAQEIFDYYDHSGDGMIDISEFVHSLQGQLPTEHARVVRDVFCGRLGYAMKDQVSTEVLGGQCSLEALTHPVILQRYKLVPAFHIPTAYFIRSPGYCQCISTRT